MTNKNPPLSSPKFRTPFTPHIRHIKEFANPSRTKQSFKDECDINNIVANFLRTGNMELIQKAKGRYLDMSDMPVSYHEALTLVVEATQTFDLLPAEIREKYGNDVNLFMQAANANPDDVFAALSKPADAPKPKSGTGVPDSPPAAPTPDPAPDAPPSNEGSN